MTNKQNQWEEFDKKFCWGAWFNKEIRRDDKVIIHKIKEWIEENFTHKQTLIDEVENKATDSANLFGEAILKKEILKLIKK